MRRAIASADFQLAAGITALALVLRLGFVLAFGRTQLGFSDPLFYHSVASSLANGGGYEFFNHPTVHWPPGYPFLLAGAYKVFGDRVVTALVVNAVLGALTVPLAYLAARRAFGRGAAITAGAGLALLPGQIVMTDVALAETLYTFELVAFVALAATLPPRSRSAVALGVLAGLAALTRGEGFLFPIIVLAIRWRPGEVRRALAYGAAVAGVMLVTVAPWTVRNALEVHAFVPVATNASTTLWTGHNPIADGGPVYSLQTGILRQVHGGNYEVAEAALLRREAIRYAIHHPLRELKLIPLKLQHLAAGDSRFISVWINSSGQRPLPSPWAGVVGRLADVASYGLLAGTLIAALLMRRPLWRVAVTRAALVFLALAVPLYGFVYYGNVRYRMPLEPLMLLVVACAAAARLASRRSSSQASPSPASRASTTSAA